MILGQLIALMSSGNKKMTKCSVLISIAPYFFILLIIQSFNVPYAETNINICIYSRLGGIGQRGHRGLQKSLITGKANKRSLKL